MKLTELAIFTEAVTETSAFYERLLGIPPVHRGEGIAIFNADGLQILIHRKYDPSESELPPENHVAFSVSNLDQEVSNLRAHGVVVEVAPRDYDWGRSAYLRDPAGNLIELTTNRSDQPTSD